MLLYIFPHNNSPQMKFPKLCLPSKVYLVLSIISIILALLLSLCSVLCCSIKLLFVFVWTWILNIICKAGYTTVSWVLVLFPIILFFVLVLYYTLIFANENNKQEHPDASSKNKLPQSAEVHVRFVTVVMQTGIFPQIAKKKQVK